MNSQSYNDRLSQLATSWTVLMKAHDADGDAAALRAAREEMLRRYSGVVRKYLHGLLRDRPDRAEAVEECFQNFALRFVSGSFKNADPGRGRFRDYLKMVLRNLAMDLHRQRRHQVQPLEDFEPADDVGPGGADQEFLTIWRDELIARALRALAEVDRPLYTILRFRMDHPDVRSADMAERLREQVGQPLNAGLVRKRLLQAREKVAELLLAELAQSLEDASVEALEQELLEVGLFEYCRSALDKRRAGRPPG